MKEHLIEFTQLAMANHDGSEDMLNRVMPKDNIGLAALLQTKPGAWSEFGEQVLGSGNWCTGDELWLLIPPGNEIFARWSTGDGVATFVLR